MRERSSQLNALIVEWDPIGLGPNKPRDEYECLIGPLLSKLESEATEPEIGDYLEAEMAQHFGLTTNHDEIVAIASRIHRWFDRGWRDPAELVTIFVALRDEGTEVWRPVLARPIGGNFYRLVGVEADVRDEIWQFPPGAIVRCEPKTFADAKVFMTAVELA